MKCLNVFAVRAGCHEPTLLAIFKYSACQMMILHDSVDCITKWILYFRGCLSWHDATWICIRPPITKAWLIYFESLNFFNRYGGKRVLLTSLSLSSFLTILFPVCARTSIYLVYAIRVSLGLLTVRFVYFFLTDP